MKLHQDNNKGFSDAIRATADYFHINTVFIEKDYWITLTLKKLFKSHYANQTVFKGGTSLSKGFGLINRFSEDVDIAIIDTENKSGNEIKNVIRTVEKEITGELHEIYTEGLTSKGSRYRKSVFEYISIDKESKSNRLIVEINSFGNTFPHQQCKIKSYIYDFLITTNNSKFIEQYGLQPFTVNILTKEQTLLEKLVSLIRFSYSANTIDGISSKIRHFYDLYYLVNDSECNRFIESGNFKNRFLEIFEHDKRIFNEPENWCDKKLYESPLIYDFANIWKQLKDNYSSELSALAFNTIPSEEKISNSFSKLIYLIR